MTKTILIPTDFSKNAWDAINYILELYENITCEVYFLNTYNFSNLNTYNFSNYIAESAFVTVPSDEVYTEYKQLSEKKLKETIEAVKFRFKNSKHSYFFKSQHTSLFYGVVDFVKEKNVDLIVMGTKGETNNTEIIYGSNAVDIMENITSCPVLMIPEYKAFHTPKEIVFSTDFKKIDDLQKLSIITEIAKNSNAKVCILHINTEEKLSANQITNKQKLENFFSEVTFEIKTLPNNTLFEALYCFVQSRDSDMVTFFSQKHGILKNIFSKPLVKSMGQRSKIPTLIMH